MAKLTTNDISSVVPPVAAAVAINANFALVETAMEKTLSRDGTAPNQMEANLDMNSYRILNLPAPVADHEPARKIDLTGITFTGAAERFYTTRAAASADDISTGVSSIMVFGYSTLGDAPPAVYVEVADTGTLEAWQFRSNSNTRRWQLRERHPDVRHFGANIVAGADATTAIQDAIDYVEAVWGKGTINGPNAVCLVSSPLQITNSDVVLQGSRGSPFIIRRSANTGVLIKIGGSTVIARSGLLHVHFQDTTNVGTFASSPYGVWYNNVNDPVNDDLQLYNENMLWLGVQLAWHGNWEVFWDGTKNYSASASAGWTVGASTGTGTRASGGIWSGGFVNIECGTIEGGGATINSRLSYGIVVQECDGFEATWHIQSYGTAAVLMQDYIVNTYGLTNVRFKDCFVDLGNGNGINILGDRAIIGCRFTNLVISQSGLGTVGARYGILITGIIQKSYIHIADANGIMRNAVYVGNASTNFLTIKIDLAYNVGAQTTNTYDIVALVACSQVTVLGGMWSGTTDTGRSRSGTYFGTATYCTFQGGQVRSCTYGAYVDSPAVDCSVIGVDAVGNVTDEIAIVGGATRTSNRALLNQTDAGP